jgi:hypothetical protein
MPIDSSEELSLSIFRIEELVFYPEDVGSRFLSTKIHGVMSQKTLIFITYLSLSSFISQSLLYLSLAAITLANLCTIFQQNVFTCWT